jgi:hypothetical protein
MIRLKHDNLIDNYRLSRPLHAVWLLVPFDPLFELGSILQG